MSLPTPQAGALPLGRWPATLNELESSYVVGLSAKRQELWHDWRKLTDALKQVVVTVPAVWLSGSFFTDKPEPGDIDCLYIIEWPVLRSARTDPRRAQFLEIVAQSKVKEAFKLQVDSFILEWVPTSSADRPERAREYLENRGYWDDLWSRERSKVPREDAVLRRGYVEVIIDGYI